MKPPSCEPTVMNVLLVAKPAAAQLPGALLAALTMAKRAAAALRSPLHILVCGDAHADRTAVELARYGAERVLVAEHAALDPRLPERYLGTIAEVASHYAVVVAPADDFGKDLLPRVAGALDCGYAGECVDVAARDGRLAFRRAIYSGNLFTWVSLASHTQVAIARQCAFDAAVPTDAPPSAVERIAPVAPGMAAARIDILDEVECSQERPRLAEARAIVSGGVCLKRRFFELLRPLADVLDAEIGATRNACNAGFATFDRQVGQTGAIVAPQLYIAAGISGAVQHLAGMRGAKVIVAINRDPEAPIFRFADYGLVADLFTAVPELVERLHAALAASKRRAAQG
jgi:electron transfer flavoprotein alpha subunit